MYKKVIYLILVLALAGCGDKIDTTVGAYKAVKQHFKSSSEAKALDALWATGKLFKVGVIDNGTNQKGYAMYVCEVLREHGIAKNKTVQIIDVVKVKSGNWVELGKAYC
ncbi:hypothetical protein A9Q74_06110 [Colwellia sp. 39_35_sub15_T18]|nr:hypothetical protein A9Q74_06110 [Colwellia sp. 39_35_sub15_T18]